MQSIGIPDDIVTIIQGIIILFVAADRIIKTIILKAQKKNKPSLEGGEDK
jgi:simple sugar transport system permease protein